MRRFARSMLLASFAALALASPSFAQEASATPIDRPPPGEWMHASSLLGEVKYPADFPRFDYANPDAPKGGVVRLSWTGSFDSFNPILPQGEAAVGLGLVFETLMARSLEESSAQYGLIADALRFPADYSYVTYRIDPEARWQDGQPVTPEDVIWSFNTVVELSPQMAAYYANVTGAEKTADSEVTFTFDQGGNRELPQIMGDLLILPQHWWEGTGPDGQPRNIRTTTLEPPMGSGPYRLDSFVPGQSVTYRRNEDYWAANKPVAIGHNNFDEIRYLFFRDETVEFEAFKGDQFDWWIESTARRWATGYDFPAAQDGRVIKELFPQTYADAGVMVGFVPNLRRSVFADERVRRAVNYAFDFEELNRTIFFGQYERIDSFFYGIPLRWQGLPQGEELEILESVRDVVPASVFTEEYKNPVGGSPEALRANLREALGLLTGAGYTLNGTQMVGPDGRQLSFEMLLNGPLLEPLALSLQANLAQIGVNMTIRTVDSAQYVNRLRSRDFDLIVGSWAQSVSPGNEQREYWGSAAAGDEASRNYGGISDPGVDALIDKIVFADDRETLEAATRALDRVLMAHNFVIPTYTLRNSRVARWDRFSHPDPLPAKSIGFPEVWWYDAAKAAAVDGR